MTTKSDMPSNMSPDNATSFPPFTPGDIIRIVGLGTATVVSSSPSKIVITNRSWATSDDEPIHVKEEKP